MKILCIGDIMLDVVAIVDGPINYASDTKSHISTHGGGAAANVASWLTHSGFNSYLIARVGDDAAGLSVLAELDALGVEHSQTIIEGANTGVVIVLVDSTGERTMFPDAGANVGVGLADLPDLSDISAIYISGYPLLNPISQSGVLDIIHLARGKNLPVIFDPASVGVLRNVGPEKVRQWLSMMDLLILNREEAEFLTGLSNPVEAAHDLHTMVNSVVIKTGASGALALIQGSEVVDVASLATDVVDSTGAGDAFAAGFIPAWLEGVEPEQALFRGSELAARCVALIGARPLVVTP